MRRLFFLSLIFWTAVSLGFLFFTKNALAQANTVECPGYWQAGICFPGGTGLSNAPVYEILYKLVWWLLAIVGFIGIIAFTISGMQYLLSAGSEKMIETAKHNMTYSIIGMVVALSGLVVIFFIHEMLSGGLVLFFNIGF